MHACLFCSIEEAENERMHLMTALVLKSPGSLFRLAVVGTQGINCVMIMGFVINR